MASISSIFPLLLLLSLSHLHFTLPTGNNHITERKSLEIIIGGGNPPPSSPSPSPEPEPEDCPPPPPPPCPPPPSPPPPCPPPPPPPLKPPQPPPLSHPPLKPPQPPPLSPPVSPPKPPPSRPGRSPPRGPITFESSLIKKVYPILQRFKNRVENDPQHILDSWKGPDVCHKYKGLICATFPGTNETALASIQFNGFNFTARLDDFLDKLETVTIFHANSNNFMGSVPDLSKLKFLFELDLSNNKLSGDFPTAVLTSTQLTFLDLRFNRFSGSVPPQVFNLDLDVLFINNNNLVQQLPKNIGSITALYLTFANNRFTGPIPDSIGNIKYLQEVLFLNNQLTGCLPYQIGMLNRATVFDVGFNQLTGPIPYSFGCLDKMEQLNLARNKFYGTIPEIVCELSCLKNLSLSYNYFTQVGPKCRELIKRNVLDVRMNCIIDLPNQKTQSECATFFMRKQSCPNPKSCYLVPCAKDPNRVKPDQERLEQEEAQASPPVSYDALNPNRIRNL